MYNIKILDSNGKLIVGKLKESASPAEYFVGCVVLFCDLRAGAPRVLTSMRSIFGTMDDLDPQLIPFYSIPLFVSWLHKHAYFSTQKINDSKDINYACFQKIKNLMHRDMKDTSLYEEFIDVLIEFKIPGIQGITITPKSKNGALLNRYCFPEDLVPEKFTCAIDSHIMDLPMIDKRNPNVVYETRNILRHLKQFRKNPHIGVELQEANLAEDSNLLKQLNLFMEKIQLVHDELYKKKDPIPYQSYMSDITNDAISIAILKAKFNKIEPPKVEVNGLNFKGIFISYPEKTKEIIKKCNLDPSNVKEETLEKTLRNLANKGLFEEIKYLLSAHKINVDAKDAGKLQRTALHWAIYQAAETDDQKYIECIKVLLANKASDEICDAGGKKPSDYIGNNVVVRTLLGKPTIPRQST